MIDGRVQVSVTLRECKADFVGRTRSPGTKSKVQVKSDARAAEPLSARPGSLTTRKGQRAVLMR